MKNQAWMMMVCCLLPVFLIFLAPALGLSKESGLFVLIPLMLLTCFMMMRKGGGCCGGHNDKKSESDTKEEEHKKHGCH